jgi:hypothetical protein
LLLNHSVNGLHKNSKRLPWEYIMTKDGLARTLHPQRTTTLRLLKPCLQWREGVPPNRYEKAALGGFVGHGIIFLL